MPADTSPTEERSTGDGRRGLSVVVPTRDRPQLLAECLAALRRSLEREDEILVCDSASRDPRIREIAEAHGARYLRLDRPGTSLARNEGWREARRELVAFVDDDIRVGPDWAHAVRRAFDERPGLAFVTGSVRVPAGGNVVHPVSVEDHPDAHDIATGEARPRGISGNLVVRRDQLMRIDGFDETLGPGTRFRAGEDKDLFDRLLLGGARGRYEPAMVVFHEQWRSRKQRLLIDWSYGIGGGARIAKLLRVDRSHARRVAREVFVRWGWQGLLHAIRKRYAIGIVASMLRVGGIAFGLAAGLTIRVSNGHFRPGRRARSRPGRATGGSLRD